MRDLNVAFCEADSTTAKQVGGCSALRFTSGDDLSLWDEVDNDLQPALLSSCM